MEENSWGRVFGALVQPARTFSAIAERPTWIAPFLVLVLLGGTASTLFIRRADTEEIVRRSLAESGRQLTEAQIERIVTIQRRFGPLLAVGTAVVGVPIAYLLVALVFWVTFRLLGGEFPFRTSWAVVLHALLPWAIAAVLTIVVLLASSGKVGFEQVKSGSLLASNLSVVAPPDAGRPLRTLLAGLDLFAVWTVILLVVGFERAAKLSRATTTATVLAVWAVYLLGRVGWVALWS